MLLKKNNKELAVAVTGTAFRRVVYLLNQIHKLK